MYVTRERERGQKGAHRDYINSCQSAFQYRAASLQRKRRPLGKVFRPFVGIVTGVAVFQLAFGFVPEFLLAVLGTPRRVPKFISPLSDLLGSWIGHSCSCACERLQNARAGRGVPATKSPPPGWRRARLSRNIGRRLCGFGGSFEAALRTTTLNVVTASRHILEHDVHVGGYSDEHG